MSTALSETPDIVLVGAGIMSATLGPGIEAPFVAKRTTLRRAD
jgi:hypothetical protein